MKLISKILAVALLLNLISMTDCAAKTLREGKFSFETSDAWQIMPIDDQKREDNKDLISIGLDEDTVITLNQNLTKLPYKNFNAMPEADKTKLKDNLLNVNVTNFQNLGYKVTVNKAEVVSDGIFLGMSLEQDGKEFALGEIYFIKDYNVYTLFMTGTRQTIVESVNTAVTLKINGVDFQKWSNS